MGQILLILLAVVLAVMVISLLVSAVHFLLWIAVVVVLGIGAVKLVGGRRRRSRR